MTPAARAPFSRRRWAVLLGVGALVAVAVVLIARGDNPADPAGEGPSGSGLTYRGEFYWLSDGEVRPDRLGAVVAEDVPMMDVTTDLRRVGDLDPDEVLAAQVPGAGGGAPRWQLVATDMDAGADPWSDAELAAVLEPR